MFTARQAPNLMQRRQAPGQTPPGLGWIVLQEKNLTSGCPMCVKGHRKTLLKQFSDVWIGMDMRDVWG